MILLEGSISLAEFWASSLSGKSRNKIYFVWQPRRVVGTCLTTNITV